MGLGGRPIVNVSQAQNYIWDVATLAWLPEQQSSGGGGGGGAVTIANGADTALGFTTDTAVTSDANGTVSGKLRGLVKILASTWDNVNGTINVSVFSVPGTLATAAKQDTGNTSLASVDTKLSQKALTAVSGSVASSGNNTLITPTSGKSLRVYYLSYNPSAAVELAFRFGASGALFLRNNLTVGGSVVAKDYGDFRYVQGAVNEALILNLTAGITTIWNVNYIEV